MLPLEVIVSGASYLSFLLVPKGVHCVDKTTVPFREATNLLEPLPLSG